jgi:hypothetical protein
MLIFQSPPLGTLKNRFLKRSGGAFIAREQSARK